MKWAYGVTTVDIRKDNLLKRTLNSLKNGGFDKPRLFVDGDNNQRLWEEEFNLEVTCRYPKIRAYGNWILGIAELYIRDPLCDRYAMFQDDFITYQSLRYYLESCPFPERGYWNLYTFPSNQSICPRNTDGSQKIGWFESNQLGKGAVALVFNRSTVIELLTHQGIVEKPMNASHHGWKSIDGGVINALKQIGYKEYVHNPSLVQHTGIKSSVGNKQQPLSLSFISENFDCRKILSM